MFSFEECISLSNNVADIPNNLSNNDTSMKFGGFKGPMML